MCRQGYRPVGPGVPPLPAPVSPAAIPYVAAEQDPLYTADSDASYAFGFAADGHERDESADADGNIVGYYSYVDELGQVRTVRYRAGAGIGFVPEADFLSDELQASFR